MHMDSLERSISASSVAGGIAALLLRFSFPAGAPAVEDFFNYRPPQRRVMRFFLTGFPASCDSIIASTKILVSFQFSHVSPQASCHDDLHDGV